MPEQGGNYQLPVGRSLYTSAVLIDTGALVASANPNDVNHRMAVDCFKSIAHDHIPLFITTPTIYDTHRRILFDLGYNAANLFLTTAYDGTINIVKPSDEDESNARLFTERYKDLQLTLTDAVNMSVMTHLGILRAFSFDRHFPLVGLIKIPPYY